MIGVMLFAFNSITMQISSDYAERYASSSAEALSAHIKKEIGLLSIAANSDTVIEWFNDEFNEEKKASALNVFSDLVNQMYSYNMYIGFSGTNNEYRVEVREPERSIQSVAVLDPNETRDNWFFNSLSSNRHYVITVDIDHIVQRKRVWLDYKVVRNGEVLGVICTGLEFSHIAGELFSQFSNNHMRGIIIDRVGTIQMDSSLMDNTDFLYSEYMTTIRDVFTDTVILNTIEMHLGEIDGYWTEIGEPDLINKPFGQHRFITIAPIVNTDWSIITLSDTTTLFETTYFVPIMIIILVLLIAFTALSSLAGYRILFRPLKKLEQSLAQLNEHETEQIFGAERDDELGHLSNTIQDLFNKANIDPLTGLYNRRFMDSSMERIMGLLSRTEGLLSVLMLDIDFFKRYNDSYGHDQGDKCLQSVAHALSYSVSRVNDIVVRYGGEEFAVLLPNTDTKGAHLFAEKLLQNVRELNLPHEKNEAADHVTISIGATTGQVDHRQDLGMYLRRADEALYMSKENGRDRYTYLDFSP